VNEREVASPCINVCTLDPATQVCLGCFRTIDEIAAWGTASNAERAAIVAELPRRRSLFDRSENAAAMPPEWRPERCARCGAQFACGADDPTTPCWCTSYPPIEPAAEASGCLCPACVAQTVASRTP
jgi:predicted Fe-S protein YdhL (DUF1289 family)